MGLEEFTTQETSNNSSVDKTTELEEELTKYGDINDTDLNLVRHHAEGKDHFNTKSRIAIQLHNTGWNVSVEETLHVTTQKRIQADVFASGGTFNYTEDNMLDIDRMAVEIGHFSQSRAKKTLRVVDVLFWADIGDSLNDAVMIQAIGSTEEDRTYGIAHEYKNSDGEVIEPDLSNIYVDRYKAIAKEILEAFNQPEDPSKIAGYVNNHTEHRLKSVEAEKLLSTMGFI